MSLPPNLARWADCVYAACKVHDVEPVIVFAHLEVESLGGDALSPPDPSGTGDHGHGRGLMQIDDRSHQDFISRQSLDGIPLWQKPLENILEGTRIIAANLRRFHGSIIPAIAAYNAGAGATHHALLDVTRPNLGVEVSREASLAACNAITEHGCYVTKVLAQVSRLNQLVESVP